MSLVNKELIIYQTIGIGQREGAVGIGKHKRVYPGRREEYSCEEAASIIVNLEKTHLPNR